MTPTQVFHAKRLHGDGRSIAAIAAELNVSRHAAWKAVQLPRYGERFMEAVNELRRAGYDERVIAANFGEGA